LIKFVAFNAFNVKGLLKSLDVRQSSGMQRLEALWVGDARVGL
jgi:hypothetical protein